MDDPKLILKRNVFTNNSTIGRLLLDGAFQCYTLEDTCRKQPGVKNCIPHGRYEMQITYSTRFKRDMPILLSVPGFDGIRIHTGNSEVQTSGCILVGKISTNDWIGESVLAYNELYPKIEEKLKQGKLWLEVSGC